MDFRAINFGWADADAEASRNPELLLDAYYDAPGVGGALTADHQYMIFGPKGTGKTAVGQRLKLLSERDSLTFATTVTLGDFPYKAFRKVSSGDVDPESKFPTSWSYLLLLKVLDSFTGDHGVTTSDVVDFERGISSLRKLSMLPAKDLKSMVMTSSKVSFKSQIPKILEVAVEAEFSGQDLAMIQLVDYLWKLIESVRSESRHYVVIDGLDDILTSNEVQYQALAALALEVSRINDRFNASRVPAKIVLLMRSDLYQKLPGTNKTKWARDSGVTINWYSDTRSPEESELLSLLNLRASFCLDRDVDVMNAWFPRMIDGQTSQKFLLDLTRHRPRDIIQLMKEIQKFTRSSEGRISRDEILGGARSYSLEYFLPEVKDELVGFLDGDLTQQIFNVISVLRSRDFRYDDLVRVGAEYGVSPDDVKRAGAALYECSVLGSVHGSQGYDHYTFKYRNPHSSFAAGGRLMLHKGIWKAMNVA